MDTQTSVILEGWASESIEVTKMASTSSDKVSSKRKIRTKARMNSKSTGPRRKGRWVHDVKETHTHKDHINTRTLGEGKRGVYKVRHRTIFVRGVMRKLRNEIAE